MVLRLLWTHGQMGMEVQSGNGRGEASIPCVSLVSIGAVGHPFSSAHVFVVVL